VLVGLYAATCESCPGPAPAVKAAPWDHPG